MLFSKAYAQDIDISNAMPTNNLPSTGDTFMMNMLMVAVLVCLFYFLMIRPQQKRFKEHNLMLDALKKGDKVVTGGGLVGTIKKIKDGESDIVVDLGNGQEVTALRSTLNKYTEVAGTASK